MLDLKKNVKVFHLILIIYVSETSLRTMGELNFDFKMVNKGEKHGITLYLEIYLEGLDNT